MKATPGSPWRRLVPLAAAVLAAHLLLLAPAGERFTPAPREGGVRFLARTVVPPPPAPAPAPAAPAQPSAPAAIAQAPPAPPTQPARPAPGPPPPPAAVSPPPAPAAPAAAPAAVPEPAVILTEPTAEVIAEPPTVAPEADASPAAPSAGLPPAQALPEPARLRYELLVQSRGFSVRGEAVLDWRHDGHTYEARLALTGPGFPGRVQRSTGLVTAEGLAPEYFSDKSRGEQATHFDRARGRVVFSSNRPPTPLAPGMQDRLSVIVQLAMLLSGDAARFPAGTEIVIPTAGTRDAEAWSFRVEGEEDLDLPGGTLRALKLQRLPRREYDQKVELWFAPRKDYAPVRLRLTNPDGGVVEQRWASTDRG